jgi:hypothetical protein
MPSPPSSPASLAGRQLSKGDDEERPLPMEFYDCRFWLY